MREEYSKWLKENPLYKFRQKNDLTRTALAGYLRLSVSTIQFWENAGNIPNDENMYKLSELMNRDYDNFRKEWHNWLDSQPPLKL